MDWLRKLFGRSGDTGPTIKPFHQEYPEPKGAEVYDFGNDEFEDEEPYSEAEMAEATARRARSEARLVSETVPVNPHLPFIDMESRSAIRSPRQVGERVLALTLMAALAEGLERERFDEIVEEQGAHDFFSPLERHYLELNAPSDQERSQLVWRYEAAYVLLWALGKLPGELGRPDKCCAAAEVVDLVRSITDFASLELRPHAELLDEADLIYRYHWASRQASMSGIAPPAGLDHDVIMERDHALNWLVGYCNLDWDDVTTDT